MRVKCPQSPCKEQKSLQWLFMHYSFESNGGGLSQTFDRIAEDHLCVSGNVSSFVPRGIRKTNEFHLLHHLRA